MDDNNRLVEGASVKVIIVALSGQKSSGKSTSSEYITTLFNAKVFTYSFAEPLKEFCMNTLGLTREQCYGNEYSKNSFTQWRWDDVDIFFKEKYGRESISFDPKHPLSPVKEIYPKSGYMTAREVMQVQGEIQRKYFRKDVWIRVLVNDMLHNEQEYFRAYEKVPIHIVDDVRHEGEIKELWLLEAIIIHLSKRTNNDRADSETEILNVNWDKYPGIHIIDNSDLTIDEKNAKIREIIYSKQHLKELLKYE